MGDSCPIFILEESEDMEIIDTLIVNCMIIVCVFSDATNS